MLSKILKKSECASCRFCCSFRRQSLWETPLFDAELKSRLESKFPDAEFRPAGKESFTINLSGCYKTDDPQEEAPCPFLNSKEGCVLSADEKPFDCKIWPLRVARKSPSDNASIVLSSACPKVNSLPLSEVKNLVESDLGEKIRTYSKEHPDIIKPWHDNFLSF
ncbi:hypothetical protein [Treponema sp.]|uniref:hypothetical protein n=1 Tax=Treponema sp. TaxID=166 RepID=UPI003F02315B